MIPFACRCGKRYKADDRHAGRGFRCPACGDSSVIPGANAVATPGPGIPCPYCRSPIDPPPARSRKCPHCRASIVVRRGRLLTEAQGAEVDREGARVAAENKARRRAERYREGRARAEHDVADARRSGVVTGFKMLVSANDCRTCRRLKDKVFPVATCKPEMLPPFAECELEEGCRATTIAVLSPRYR